MKFSMTGQENYDLLIQVTAWAGLTKYVEAVVVLIVWELDLQLCV